MAKQTFTTGQVLTAAQMTSLQSTAMGGGDTTAKTASYVLVAADAGTVVAMNAAGATTITVNTALFAAGDTVTIQNRGAGVCTVTAGTATVVTAGSLALAQNEGGILYFTATGAAIFYDYVQSGSAGITFSGSDVQATSNQTLTNNTDTYINFDSEIFDVGDYHSNVTNNSRFTVPAGKAGYFALYASVNFASNSTGLRFAALHKNGASIGYTTRTTAINGSQMWISVSGIAYGAVGDYFQVQGYQTSGGNLISSYSEFGISYLGA